MNLLPPTLRFIIVTTIALVWGTMVAANPLAAYRNQNRLIVIYSPDSASMQKVATLLAEHRAQLDERDIKIIDVSDPANQIPQATRMGLEQSAAIRKELRIDPGEARAAFLLIGKDGGEKARQSDAIQLAKLFALIDQMPMRREEIKSQQSQSQ